MTPDVELARSLGTHALGAFGALLGLLLVAVGFGWAVLHHALVRPHRLPERAATRWLLATLALGFLAIAAAGVVFAALPPAIVDGGRVAAFDHALTDAIRSHVELAVLRGFAVFTLVANSVTQWSIGIVGTLWLAWRRERLLAWAWGAAFAGNGLLTRLLKATFERARPDRDHDLLGATGWSFPSGHSSGAVVICGMLAYLALRRTRTAWHLPIVLVAAALAFTIGCSRIFLQVHYASDVLAGFALGAAWLGVCVGAAELIRTRRARADDRRRGGGRS